ncbi:MAG: patatin-like phospholipase family protein [Candidatus Rokubacteria bacterium]|nr:patatin-like phospholipase family protein [Candidatus Rokubacteria bacterium]
MVRGRGKALGSLFLAALLLLGAALPPRPAPAAPAGCEPSPRDPTGLRVGLVFSGGGAKAAYEAGFALALHERSVVPAAVAGTSSGALNAVMVATGEAERLAALWRTVRREDVFRYPIVTILGGLFPGWFGLSYFRDVRSVLDPSPLRRTIERHLDLARLRESPVRLLILTADLVSGQPRRFDNATLTVDALMASATVPALFPVVPYEGGMLVDGGIVQRAPTLELLDTYPLDRLLVVLGYESEPLSDPTVQPVLERAFEIALTREILRDVELARFRHPGVEIRVLRPSEPLRLRPLDFDGTRLGHLVALGRRDGLVCLAALGYGP